LHGDNLMRRSQATPWYDGPTLLEHLEAVEIEREAVVRGFRLPVQWVNRPNQDFRGFAGTLVGGEARVGQNVVVLPSGRRTRIARLLGADGE
ncbi:sulfate adenylyltransferase subunit CysN, partial [Salmonella enterica]|nr:sulfate adenylyltransferase subunit CysN [Salmonella enterica]